MFDAVGTLLHPDPPFIQVYLNVAQRYGVCDLEPHAVLHAFRQVFAEEEAKDQAAGWRTSEEREVQRWRRIVAACLPEVTEQEACFQELFLHFAQPESWRTEVGIDHFLEWVAESGRVLGLASNYDSRLRSVIAGHRELQRLRHLLISSELGWRKPGIGFFRAICERLAVPPSAMLLVGDDVSNDIKGAQEAGWQAVLIDPADRHPEVSPRLRRFAEAMR